MNKIIDFEKKLKDLCYSIYPKKIIGKIHLTDEEKLFHDYLRNNRLIHALKPTEKEYENYKKNVKPNIAFLNKILGEKNYLVIKTFSSYPHITSDFDVVVKTKEIAEKVKKELKEHNFDLPIDVNHIVSWTESEEISHKFIWDNTKIIKFEKMNITVPNANLDTLIRIGHIPFELAEVRLGEFMHILSQFKDVEWVKLQKEAEKMHWPKTFRQMEKTVDKLYYELYHQNLLLKKKHSTGKKINFPHRISYLHLAQATIEKKSWKKIWGARYVLRDRLGLS